MAIELIQDYYKEIVLSVLVSAVLWAIFRAILLSRDRKRAQGKAPGAYTVYVPIGGRAAVFAISMFGLGMGVLFFGKSSFEGMLLGAVSAFIFVLMLVRTILYCTWRVEVQGETLTLYRLLRAPKEIHHGEITLVSKSSQGYTLYRGSEKLFDFTLGKEKNDPGNYMLMRDLEERDQWTRH